VTRHKIITRAAAGAAFLFFVGFQIAGEWIDIVYLWGALLVTVIVLAVVYRWSASASSMSGKIADLSKELRDRAAALEDRFGRKPKPVTDSTRDTLAELSRVAALRGYQNVVEAIASFDTGEPMHLRTTAEALDRFAASLHGTVTPYHLTARDLVWSAVTLSATAAGGGYLIHRNWFDRGVVFNIGIGLVVVAVGAAVILFLMQTERN
jgi:hypothetical protein